jgi:L-alanine-DL-glutamate epimerase-like enolase superfamily enzyme
VIRLTAAIERFPIAGRFTISRGSKTEAVVVVATISDGEHAGRGECVPYARYGETPEGVIEAILSVAGAISANTSFVEVQRLLPPGAARNALDCALWDFDAKRYRTTVHGMFGLPAPRPVATCTTISLGTPDEMAAAAAKSGWPLLKLKLGGEGDPERLAAVRAAVPDTRLVVDANEAWTTANFEANVAACAAAGVELIEQPLPAGADAELADRPHPIPICADESIHGLASLDAVLGRYDAINIKLDKTGGLSEALALLNIATGKGLKVMVGSMVATSLSMAPALLVAQGADWADLDGPMLLARDRDDGLSYADGLLHPRPALWGSGT